MPPNELLRAIGELEGIVRGLRESVKENRAGVTGNKDRVAKAERALETLKGALVNEEQRKQLATLWESFGGEPKAWTARVDDVVTKTSNAAFFADRAGIFKAVGAALTLALGIGGAYYAGRETAPQAPTVEVREIQVNPPSAPGHDR